MDGLIDYVVEADAQQVVYHALALPDEPASQDALRAEMTSLRRAARRAELHDLVIAIENLAPLYPGREFVSASPKSMRTAARQLASDGHRPLPRPRPRPHHGRAPATRRWSILSSPSWTR